MYPGYGDRVGTWEGYTGYYQDTLPGTIFSLFLRLRPYLRPNEAKYKVIDEVSQIGSRNGLRMTSELTRIDPPETPPRLVPR